MCRTIYTIKYIYKYVYKGANQATIYIKDYNNKITITLNSYYITLAIVIQNIILFYYYKEKPLVIQLAYYLEGRYNIQFNSNLSKQQLKLAAKNQTSIFTAQIDYNYTYNSRNLTLQYQDFLAYYYQDKLVCVQRKQKQNTPTISCLYAINLN